MIRRQNLLSIFIIGLLNVALVAFIALFFISLARNSRLQAEISSKYNIINKYVKKSKMPISKESIQLLMDKRNKLKSVYSRFKLAFTSPLNEEISEQDLDPLQFKERLIQIQKKLREDADNHNLLLPESLGFTKYETELLEPTEIPHLIKRLKTLEELIYTMTLADIESLDEITFDKEAEKTGKAEDVKPKKAKAKSKGRKKIPDLPVEIGKRLKVIEKEQPDVIAKEKEDVEIYFDIPISLTIHCTNSRLIDFLYRLRSSSFTFVVEGLDIEKIEDAQDEDEAVEGRLKASLLIKAITLN